MERLVYAPKAFAYIKTQQGIVDVTNYIVSGSVTRKISQVSNASLILRNPKMIFTTRNENGEIVPATFHPMDPITIFLRRLSNRSVRVFTGFLDNTQYYQMYPGPFELRASCTLKKLLYNYFDPALVYTQSFFAQYGWINVDGAAKNLQGLNDWQKQQQSAEAQVSSAGTTAALKDGSLAELLFATLNTIGGWDPKRIYIERLPKDLITKMTNLAKEIDADNDAAKTEFSDLMSAIIGAGSYGDGGTGSGDNSTGDVKGANKVVPIMTKIANQLNIPPAFVVAVGIVETNLSGKDTASNPHYGWFQMQTANPPYAYGRFSKRVPTQAEAHDLGIATTAFCEAAQGWLKRDSSLNSNWQLWAERVQGITPGDTGNSRYTDASQWNGFVKQAKSLVSQYGKGDTSTSKTADTNTSSTGSTSSTDPSSSNNAAYVNPFKGASVTPSRVDQGVDYGITGPIRAIGNAKVVFNGTYSGFGTYVVYRLTNGSKAGRFIYISEGISPTVKVGDVVSAGDVIAHGHGGIETGWAQSGSGFLPIAKITGGYNEGQRTAAGDDFNEFMVSLGVVRGTVSGRPTVGKFDSGTNPKGTAVPDPTGGGGNNDPLSIATAASFAATLEFPSRLETVEAMALQGEKSLMNDVPLLPFVQQLCQASLREFQSMPNGDFFAFCPDYFGETYHRKPYWYIDDIEVMDGGIELSDDALVTHMYVVGDTTFTGNEQLNRLSSAGTLTIFNVFMADGILNRQSANGQTTNSTKGHPTGIEQEGFSGVPEDSHGMDTIIAKNEALAFLKRYGARPAVEDMPMIHNPYFEMFLAYQKFLLAWSRQFLTPFTFTFMPELFPGGKVGFPDHGLQMYIDEVTHTFDYTSGFTTQAGLSAPSVFTSNGLTPTTTSLPPNMVEAMFEPVKKK